jgi:Universal stress protein family
MPRSSPYPGTWSRSCCSTRAGEEASAANGADLLVVGTRGRSPFMGGVLGAVSLRCAAGASCPVTLVKLAGDHPQGQAPPSPA